MSEPKQEYMTVEIRIALPVDVKALARLSRELQAALFRTGLTYLPPVVRGQENDAEALDRKRFADSALNPRARPGGNT